MPRFTITIPASKNGKISPDLEAKITNAIGALPQSERQRIQIIYRDMDASHEPIFARRYESLQQLQRLYQDHGGPITVSYQSKKIIEDTEKFYDGLLEARTSDRITLTLKDGSTISGALIFNPFKAAGRLIDAQHQSSADFFLADIARIEYTT